MMTLYFPPGEKKQTDLLKAVVKECREILQEPEKSKAKAATKILGACISVSGKSTGSL